MERGGEEVRRRKYDGSTVRQAASSGSTMGELFCGERMGGLRDNTLKLVYGGRQIHGM